MSAGDTPYVAPGGVRPCLPLVPTPTVSQEGTDVIEFTFKVRAGGLTSAPTYKCKMARFAGRSPEAWIEVLEALEEVFLQNGLASAYSRENIIEAILHKDSLIAYESHVLESRINVNDLAHPLPHTIEVVNSALSAVSQDVFPHRALDMQKLWMKRHMKKPGNMGIWKFVAAVSIMNSKLICYVGATGTDLFFVSLSS